MPFDLKDIAKPAQRHNAQKMVSDTVITPPKQEKQQRHSDMVRLPLRVHCLVVYFNDSHKPAIKNCGSAEKAQAFLERLQNGQKGN